jgi:hypothetical protein
MSDLSQLLGDLYADDTPSTAPSQPAEELATRAPAWSSEDALDEAFATWVPGPSDDAPSAERSIVAGAFDTRPAPAPAPAPEVDDWRRDTAPALESPTVHARWAPSDDDILPARRARKRR